jgi:hypothetical protein
VQQKLGLHLREGNFASHFPPLRQNPWAGESCFVVVLAVVLTVAVTFAAHLTSFFPLLYFDEGEGNFAAVGGNLHLLAALECWAYFAVVDDIPVYQNFFLSYVVSLLFDC